MAKLWRFLSISIVAAVCLGLMLVPAAVPLSNKVALAAQNVTIEIQPSTTTVLPGDPFNVSVVIQNPGAVDIYGCQARLDFDSSYFNVTGITGGTLFTYVLTSAFSNATGTVDYDSAMPLPPGTPTNATSILVCNISCQALAKEGMSTIDFSYETSVPFRKTRVTLAAFDYLENGNMSLMHSGTVKIGLPKLTVNVTPALKGDVNISGVIPSFYPNTTNRSWDEVVELTAVSSVPNWTFTQWSGNLTGSANPTNITMDDNKNVTANFAPSRTLTMNVTGNGTTVPAVGSHTYGNGTVVNISADPDSGWEFVNWTTVNMEEITNSTAQSTTVTVDENKTVTATFAEVITATLEGNVTFSGRGIAPDDKWVENFTVRFFQGASEVRSDNITTNSSGYFNVTGIDSGTYNVSIKSLTSLQESVPGVVLNPGNTTVVNFGTTREGDSNGDNVISSKDKNQLYTAFYSTPGDPNWNFACDYNRDEVISSKDKNILYGNFYESGD